MSTVKMPYIILTMFVISMLTSCGGNGSDTTPNGDSGSGTIADGQMGGAIQGKALSLINVVTSIAGIANTSDGTGAGARFSGPTGITTDGANLYVADSANCTIRKIVISTGTVTTLAGTAGPGGWADGIGTAARFNNPRGITTDGTNLYVADYSCTIRKIVIATGEVITLAGSANNFGSVDGIGTAAKFLAPTGITTDGTNLYVTDNSAIRKIVISTGHVSTLAGSAGFPGSANGAGATARFTFPNGITTDGTNLYVADSGNYSIRKIEISTGTVTTLSGGFPSIAGITTDGVNLYVTDSYSMIHKIELSSGIVTTVAGTGTQGAADGSGVAAGFDQPQGITTDGTNLYVADTLNNAIRKVVISTCAVTTLAGTIGADGIGVAASFFSPYGITTDGTNLYVTDVGNGTIRKIVIATGAVTTLAGTAGAYGFADGTGSAARFGQPMGITTDGTYLYVADASFCTIRKIRIATGVVTTLAGSANNLGATDGTGTAAKFFAPSGITTDGTYLYVTDKGNGTIRKIVIATGAVTTLAGTTGAYGFADGTGTAARFSDQLIDITTDGANLFVADSSMIRKIVISDGAVTTLAGTAELHGSTDGIGAVARFYLTKGITADGTNLYVTDANDTIRKVVISTGVVTTLAGSAHSIGSSDGIGNAASFYFPQGITTDGTNLYVVDYGNNIIRSIH